jgi:hypothetical protein
LTLIQRLPILRHVKAASLFCPFIPPVDITAIRLDQDIL